MSSVTLTNANGLSCTILSYGGVIQRLVVPDRTGTLGNIVLGFADESGYHPTEQPYIGAMVGRYAGRIANAQFSLDGTTYALAANDNGHSLHGGDVSFSHHEWELTQQGATAVLTRTSPDGEDGYPGTLQVTITLELTDDDRLITSYVATTDAPTVINLTNHTYFNLAGEGSGTVVDHVAQIAAEAFLPIDATLIPTGEVRSVAGTPMDFRTPTRIGDRLYDGGSDQIRYGKGYDITYVLNRDSLEDDALVDVCTISEPTTGRTLAIRTTEPGAQFYTGCMLASDWVGTSNRLYPQFAGFCVETQHFPDSPNKPAFPSVVLRPGETYRHVVEWAFGTERATAV